jgi:hypothetical protein
MWGLRPKREYYRGKPDDGLAAKIIPLFPVVPSGLVIRGSRNRWYKYYEGLQVILQTHKSRFLPVSRALIWYLQF